MAVLALMTLLRSSPRRDATDVQGLRIPERTLMLMRDLIESRAGIHYDDDRLDLMRDRVAPLAIDRGFDSLLDYYYLLKYDLAASDEWPRVMNALSVAETYFWREPDQLEALANVIMPQLVERRRQPIRIWSVPCASGEEPLSIAIALDRAGWFSRADIEIHASDASETALERARTQRFGRRSFRQLPDDLRQRYFSTNQQGDAVVADDILRRITSWTRVNVMSSEETAPFDRADVIFCRNLFIYFTPDGVRQVVGRLATTMPSPGYLCVGAAESLLRLSTDFDLQDLGGAYVYVKS